MLVKFVQRQRSSHTHTHARRRSTQAFDLISSLVTFISCSGCSQTFNPIPRSAFHPFNTFPKGIQAICSLPRIICKTKHDQSVERLFSENIWISRLVYYQKMPLQQPFGMIVKKTTSGFQLKLTHTSTKTWLIAVKWKSTMPFMSTR